MLVGIMGTFENPWNKIFYELPSFSELIQCEVGDGVGTYFLEDRWLGFASFIADFLVFMIKLLRKIVLLLSWSFPSFLFGFC